MMDERLYERLQESIKELQEITKELQEISEKAQKITEELQEIKQIYDKLSSISGYFFRKKELFSEDGKENIYPHIFLEP